MADARIDEVIDAVAGAIRTWWAAANGGALPAGAAVLANDLPDLNEDPQGGDAAPVRPVGRFVCVLPAGSDHVGQDNRAEDLDEHRVAVVVVEWFDGADVPDLAWVRARRVFLDSLWRLLRNARAEPPVVAGCWPAAAAVGEWYDPAVLRTDRAYFGSLVVAYREVTENVTAP